MKPKSIARIVAGALAGSLLACTAAFAAVDYDAFVVKNDAGIYTLDVHYPETGYETLDMAVKKMCLDAINETKLNAAEYNNELVEQFGPCELFINYKVGEEPSRNIISETFTIEGYITGAAHGFRNCATFNYDTKADKLLGIDDVFKKDSGYVKFLSKKCVEKMEPELRQALFVSEGELITKEELSIFAIGEKCITFIFPPYQIAPWAAGTIFVDFTYDELEGYLAI